MCNIKMTTHVRDQPRTSASANGANASRRNVRRALPVIQGIAFALVSLLIAPSFAEPVRPCSCDPSVQTQQLHERLESLRSRQPQVSLSFTGLHQAFAIHHAETQLRLRDCTYDVRNDVAGLIDILLAAKISVGYPASWGAYQPEARFGVYFDSDFPDGLDLWFSNPMTPRGKPASDAIVLGQSHDRGEVTAYRITATPELRNDLWAWAQAHGYPRQDTAAECQTLEKYDPPQPSPK
jgi:hypothetical protein